jgi:hypothetical protein
MANCKGAGGEIHPACHPDTDEVHKICDCGCEVAVVEKCEGGLDFHMS